MASYESFYPGADYGLDPNYGLESGSFDNFSGYRLKAGDIGYPTDPTTANQLDVTSKKLSTGAKTIEISGVNIMGGGAMKLLDSIPKQQFEEINRLKKLAGAELTFHGPLVEPTGVSRQGWDESQREEAERQITDAITRGHQLDPKGNIVVTFHSSNGLPEPETTIIDPKTGKPKTTSVYYVDEREGRFVPVGPAQKDYFKKDVKADIKQTMEKQNKDQWFRELQHASFNAYAGEDRVEKITETDEKIGGDSKATLDFYKKYVKNPEEAEKVIKQLGPEGESLKSKMLELTHGDIYLRDAYQSLQGLFNNAYETLDKDKGKSSKIKKDFLLLDKYRKEMAQTIEKIEEDPSKIKEFSDKIIQGVNVLRQIDPPQRLKPLKEFAVDKASDTFSGAAFSAYKKFKDTAPIISIENPPMGMGLAEAKDLKNLVEESRKKFVAQATKPTSDGGAGLSKSEAKKQAEKLIGVTWDVGHINMIRKYGYDEKEVIKQTKTIAPYVKHVHLSDNFGMEHTELPMGMGNVPTKPMLEAIEKYNKQVKKIVETGDWFSRQGGLSQTQTPVLKTLTEFGSSAYGTGGPYWNQMAGSSGYFFGGIGPTNPEIHHSIYGAGFSNLPVEMGGQMAGRSRMGGAPME